MGHLGTTWKGVGLKQKMIAMGLGLVIVPSIVIGGLSLHQFRTFSRASVTDAYEGLTHQALEMLEEVVLKDHQRISQLLTRAEQQVLALSTQPMVTGCFPRTALLQNRSLVIKETTRTLEGVVRTIAAQRRLILQKLDADLSVADYILEASGGIEQEGLIVEWPARNPVTHQTVPAVLPLLQVGFDTLSPTLAGDAPLPMVDRVETLVGTTCTLYQQMNARGDMLAVATSARTKSGKRAIGEVLPGTPVGKTHPHPDHNRHEGRVPLAGDHYLALFKELKDVDATPVGMISVGVREKDLEAVAATILNTRLGATGYALVMDRSGTIIFHPDPSMIGRSAGETGLSPLVEDTTTLTPVTIDQRQGFAMATVIPGWEWVVVVLGFWDDFQSGKTSEDTLNRELNHFMETTRVRINGKTLPLFFGIAVTDNEKKVLGQAGMPPAKETLFPPRLTLPPGSVIWDRVKENRGKTVLPLATAIVRDGKTIGGVTARFNWELVWEALKNRVYGQSGHAHVAEVNGRILSPPGQGPGTAAPLGELPWKTLGKGSSSDGVWQGKSRINGMDRYGAAKPLAVGDTDLIVGATVPANEFLELADTIRQRAETTASRVTITLGITTVSMIGLGALLGILLATSMVHPIIAVIGRVKEVETRGDLTLELALPGTAELRHLAATINSFIRTLRSVVQGILTTSEDLDLAANGLTTVSSAMTTGTNAVATTSTRITGDAQRLRDHLKKMTGAMDEASSNVSAMALSADQLNQTLVDVAHGCDNAAAETREAVTRSRTVSTQVRVLKTAAAEIDSVTATINTISRQTNLLALNATIEAARAGTAGKGFAVVANEIKALSDQTETATQEIRSQILEIQDATRHTVTAIQKTDTVIHAVNATMTTIATAVEEQSGTVSGIAAHAALASEMIGHVKTGVNQGSTLSTTMAVTIDEMNRAMDEISQNSGQVMASADQLTHQAGEIRAMVRWFKIR